MLIFVFVNHVFTIKELLLFVNHKSLASNSLSLFDRFINVKFSITFILINVTRLSVR